MNLINIIHNSSFDPFSPANQLLSEVKGTTRPRVNLGHIRGLKILLAPLSEQKRIVTKLEKLLEKVDKCKERLEKMPAIIERFRQSVLASAFSGALTKDWRKRNKVLEPVESILERIKKHRISTAESKRELNQILKYYGSREDNFSSINLNDDLPVRWVVCQIGDIGNVCNGSTPSRKIDNYWNGNISWVSSGEVRNNLITETREKISEAGYENSSMKILPKGTVLLAMIGEGKTRGQSSILSILATINQNIAGIIIDHGLISSEYLWYWFQHQYISNRQVGSGSGPQALNCQRVRELPFNFSPLEEQKEIVKRIQKLLKVISKIEKRYISSTGYTKKLSQSILAKAFRGELVPQDPNDEPASELLKRIKAEKDKASAIKLNSRLQNVSKKQHKQASRVKAKKASNKRKVNFSESSPLKNKSVGHTERTSQIKAPRVDRATQTSPPFAELNQNSVMAAFRQVCRVNSGLSSDNLLREVARAFGYQRLSPKIKPRLQGDLHAAKIRKIIYAKDGLIYPATLTIDDYETDMLVKVVYAVTPKGKIQNSEAVIRDSANYLGFKRISAGIRSAFVSALEAAIETDGIRREIDGYIRR